MISYLQVHFHIPFFRNFVFFAAACGELLVKAGVLNESGKNLYANVAVLFRALAERRLINADTIYHLLGYAPAEIEIQKDLMDAVRFFCQGLADNPVKLTSIFLMTQISIMKAYHVKYHFAIHDDTWALLVPIPPPEKSMSDYLKEAFKKQLFIRDKAYPCERFGIQDCQKNMYLMRLPPVFTIQLNRFKQVGTGIVKDCSLVPLEQDIDLWQYLFNEKEYEPLLKEVEEELKDTKDFLPSQSRRSIGAVFGGIPRSYSQDNHPHYKLLAIAVHSGSHAQGHYYTFVKKQEGDNQSWWQLDDKKVTVANWEEVCEYANGISEEKIAETKKLIGEVPNGDYSFLKESGHCAYFLVYVRDDYLDEIMCCPKSDDGQAEDSRNIASSSSSSSSAPSFVVSPNTLASAPPVGQPILFPLFPNKDSHYDNSQIQFCPPPSSMLYPFYTELKEYLSKKS
jgi:hypothetical protein